MIYFEVGKVIKVLILIFSFITSILWYKTDIYRNCKLISVHFTASGTKNL